MLKVLLKKQLMELFKGYFYDAKKGTARSKTRTVLMFVLFGILIVGIVGGMFTTLSVTLCEGLEAVGMGWLFFVFMAVIAIALGAVGSVFNTFSALYLSKDNNLLLSMPIEIKDIVASRLLTVYLLGSLYSAVVFVPALIINWVMTGPSLQQVLCGILLLIFVTVVVLVLSCLLGWCVAKISLKLKSKSLITVLIALVCIGAYYFLYYRVSFLIQMLLANAEVYGARIKGSAYLLYLFGCIGEGNIPAALLFLVINAALLAATWLLLKNTFLSIATAVGDTGKKKKSGERLKGKTPFQALLSKEFSKFISCPNYMLNRGLGTLFIPAFGVLVLLKGPAILGTVSEVFGEGANLSPVLLCAVLCMLVSMNDTVSASVSLEGKSLWIAQSLPVEAKQVLRAKAAMNLLLTGVPMLFGIICAEIIVSGGIAVRLLMLLFPLVYVFFAVMFDSFLGVRMPNLSWTNEIVPIKQGWPILISMFGGWAVVIAIAALYLAVWRWLSAPLYLAIWTCILAVLSFFLLRWLDTKGAERFSDL